MIETVIQILGTESTKYLTDLLRERTKKTTIRVTNFANQIAGANAEKCRKVLSYISTIGYGEFISANGKEVIKSPKTNSKFRWRVAPREFVKELERPREFRSELVKKFERPRELNSELAKVEREQIFTTEEFSYKKTVQQSTTKAQKTGPKN